MGAVLGMQCLESVHERPRPGSEEMLLLMNTPGGYKHLLKREMPMRNTLRLSIEGMHCGGCVHRVTTTLQDVEGVELGPVEVGSAQLTFDPGLVSAEAIACAVNRIGFSARIE